MFRRTLEIAAKSLIVVVASTAFAHAATAPRLNAEQWAMCEGNNPWVKSGWCAQNDAWNKWRCFCPQETVSTGVGGPDTEVASNPTTPGNNCSRKDWTSKVTFTKFR
jgi:hypothetical protein